MPSNDAVLGPAHLATRSDFAWAREVEELPELAERAASKAARKFCPRSGHLGPHGDDP